MCPSRGRDRCTVPTKVGHAALERPLSSEKTASVWHFDFNVVRGRGLIDGTPQTVGT
jgi:hypothetical protein